jgi:hypothetical protein
MKALIHDFEDLYEVTEDGVVFNVKTGEELKATLNPNGYLKVALSRAGTKTQILLHRLVALHFVPNPGRLPQVNHLDGNKTNNHYTNLEWCTCSHNRRHAITNRLTKRATIIVPYAELNAILERNINGVSIRSLAQELDVQEESLARLLRQHAESTGQADAYAAAGVKAKGAAQVKNRKGVRQYDLDGNLVAIHVSVNAAAKALGRSSPGAISNALNRGHLKQSLNFLWSWDA